MMKDGKDNLPSPPPTPPPRGGGIALPTVPSAKSADMPQVRGGNSDETPSGSPLQRGRNDDETPLNPPYPHFATSFAEATAVKKASRGTARGENDDETPSNSLRQVGGHAFSGGRNHDEPNGFFEYFISSYRVTWLLIAGLAIYGIWTALTLPRESAPEVEIPFAAVVTAYPGSSSRDVEELVTIPVENELLAIEGLKNLTSSSQPGVSVVNVEFSADEDLQEALRRLRERVDQITGLPDLAEQPRVIEISFADEPIISLSLGGVEDQELLTTWAEEIADELERVPGVSAVEVAGGLQREVRIVAEPQRLAELGLSAGQIIGAIRASNMNLPFGRLETAGFNYDLRITSRFTSPGDVADIPLTLPRGGVTRIGDVARVEVVTQEQATFSRLTNEDKTTPAVTLTVRKRTGAKITTVVEEVLSRVEEYREANLPAEVTIVSFADMAAEIRKSLSNVTKSGMQTLLIVFALLWLFLGWRSALVASLAVPLTFSISLIFFDLTDTSLNGISLFSLILSLGLLVDTAIVIVEGVHRHENEPLEELERSALGIVQRFKKPLIGGTLTTVAAFFPMLLVTGIIGEFLKVIPIVVAATLLSSLAVALLFIPVSAAHILARWRGEGNEERWFDVKFQKLRHAYANLIAKVLDNRRQQRILIGSLVLLLGVGLSLPFTGLLSTGLFPSVDTDFLIINVELPSGARIEETTKIVEELENILKEVPEVNNLVTNIGSSTSLDFSGGGGSSESLASFYVNLDSERERSSLEVTADLRKIFGEIAGAAIVVEELSAGPPTAAPVEIRVVSEDLDLLDESSEQVVAVLEATVGAIDVERDLKFSAGEFNFVFVESELAKAGLAVSDMAQLLRASVFGQEATSYLDSGEDEVAVRFELLDDSVNTIDGLLLLPIVTPAGTVRLGQLAVVETGTSLNSIRRRDGERTVTITANADGRLPNEVTEEVLSKIEEGELPSGVRLEVGGEQQETVETFAQLYRSMIIAVLLILIILVVEFNSYRQPLIIFMSIPLALAGVLFGLMFFRGQLNFAAFIGMVSLTGIVVNNAILLVDRMNVLVIQGKDIKDAVKEAAGNRLRPILLTTFTTAAGVAPLIWVDEFFRDMALTLITGLTFSTVITLVLIPVLYYRQQVKIAKKKLVAE